MLHKRRLKVVELLLSQGFVTERQIIKVIKEQKRTNRDIASLIVEMGFITRDELTAVLGEQIQVTSKKRLGEVLLDHALITPEQLEQALEVQRETHETIGHCLVRLQFIDEDKLLDVLGAQLDTPHVVLDHIVFNHKMLEIVPISYIEEYKVVPLFLHHNQLTIAMADPTNLRTLEHLRFTTGKEIDPVIASEASIDHFIQRLKSNELQEVSRTIDMDKYTIQTIDEGVEGTPASTEYDEAVVAIVNSLVADAIAENASDIHIECMRDSLRVRFRIDGTLVERRSFDLRYHIPVISRLKILSNLDVSEKRQPQNGKLHIHHREHHVDIHVSTFPAVSPDRGVTEKAVLRILDSDAGNFILDNIGFPGMVHQAFRHLLTLRNGMILVVGPSGSGKTSTVYAALKDLAGPEVNIVTIEDPVEYALEGISQGQIVPEAGFTYAAGVRSFLWQDPDIIMVGELSDEAVAEAAVNASLTGHLVFSTLYSADAPAAVTRLLDMGIEPYLVSSSLKGVVAQRLVRKICPHCREEYRSSESMSEEIGYELPEKIFRGRGCVHCNHTGYKGRTAIFELLVPDETVQSMIMQKRPAHEIREYAVEHCQMETLRYQGYLLIAEGVTTLDEVLMKTERDTTPVKK